MSEQFKRDMQEFEFRAKMFLNKRKVAYRALILFAFFFAGISVGRYVSGWAASLRSPNQLVMDLLMVLWMISFFRSSPFNELDFIYFPSLAVIGIKFISANILKLLSKTTHATTADAHRYSCDSKYSVCSRTSIKISASTISLKLL